MRDARPVFFQRSGSGTFVDPANGGGKLNARTTEELVRLIEIDGEPWLFYKAFPINVAIIRGTTADHNGNISMEKEALTLDNLALATAAKNCKGFVIAQVERIAASGSLNPRHVKIPSVLIDCVVVAQPENHVQTYATGYNGAFSGELRAPADRNVPMPLDNRKIIARRCALELPMGGVVNLGIGMPEGVASVAAEEKLFDFVTLTAEPGIIGGIPQGGLDFGAAINAESIIDQNQMFDFYDGGGLDWPASAWRRSTAAAMLMSACSTVAWPAPADSSTYRRMRVDWSSQAPSPPAGSRRRSWTVNSRSSAKENHRNSSTRSIRSRFRESWPRATSSRYSM